jgi:hypothetical protein
MRACDRRRVAAGLPIYVPLTTSSIIRGVTVSTAESLSYIRKSKAQGRGSSGNGRDASGRHPRSESVAFGLSRNGNCAAILARLPNFYELFFPHKLGISGNSLTINEI